MIGLAVVVAGCARNHPTTTVNSASGEVGQMDGSDGVWVDAVGGIWMDPSGLVRMGGRDGLVMGLQPRDIGTINNENIVAHIRGGDSLEVVLSQLGLNSATNSTVRDFAQEMISDHTAHREKETKLSVQTGMPPVMAPGDTEDVDMTARIMSRLSNTPAGPAFDRQFMTAEVLMHRHMLRDLTTFQPYASGATQDFVTSTVSVVQRHLKEGENIQKSLGPDKSMHR
jgi:predicted outer membrane protein